LGLEVVEWTLECGGDWSLKRKRGNMRILGKRSVQLGVKLTEIEGKLPKFVENLQQFDSNLLSAVKTCSNLPLHPQIPSISSSNSKHVPIALSPSKSSIPVLEQSFLMPFGDSRSR
jgi:hypothetical protein